MVIYIEVHGYSIAKIIYEARNNLLSGNMQNRFSNREGGYNLRGNSDSKKLCVWATMKSMCISVCGVNLWIDLDVKLKQSTNINQFKKININITFLRGIWMRKGCVNCLSFIIFLTLGGYIELG